MKQFGIVIFKGNNPRIRKFNKATSIESFARIYLRSKMREEGINHTEAGLAEYLDSWLEWSEDMEQPATKYFEIIDTVADTLTYSNVHLQKKVGNTWLPISSAEKVLFADAIIERLSTIPEKV